MSKIEISSLASREEINNRQLLEKLFQESPLPENERLSNVGLFLKRQELQKVLFFNELYQKFVNTHGIIIEFGTRWGQNLITLSNLRGIYEPYNYNRKIVGFDTFEGFKNITEKDGFNEIAREGAFSVTDGYENYLQNILAVHENESPLQHIKKYEIIKGDASDEFEKYLKNNPQTIVAFAYFDFDIYKPTVKCLRLLKNHITKGSIIGFDELNDPKFPGETLAMREVFSMENIKIERNRYSGMQSYILFE